MRCKPSGPLTSEVLFVGEAPGKDEEALGAPFLGASGKLLRRMLDKAGWPSGLDEHERIIAANQSVRMTNVFMERPPDNDLKAWCTPKRAAGADYPLPPLSTGQYMGREHLHELDRLRDEIRAQRPRLIVALGNTPCWALLRRTGIGKLRGSVFDCELEPGIAVLPTYHPAAILRDYSLKVVAQADLLKAKRYLDEGFAPRKRERWLDPTREEMETFKAEYLDHATIIAFDVETKGGSVTCIGFSPTPDRAICVPFYDPRKPSRSFWPDVDSERWAWQWVKDVLQSRVPKVAQNGLYDVQYCVAWGIQPQNVLHDTMIRHHAYQPELEKGLGFLGSIYTDEAPWKLMRPRNKDNYREDDE